MNKTIKHFILDFLAVIIILMANLILVWPLFIGGYTQQIGSIESVFLADARFIFENFPHLSWNPYWYAGFPFHLFYTPLMPFLIALLHFLYSSTSITSWYRILIGVFYALTPVSFYFLVSFLTNKKRVGFLGAMLYSFLPSSAYLLSSVESMGSIYGKPPWRLLTLILFGEGGHIVGLFFLPLALLFFIKAIREGGRKNVFLASILTALIALTNMIALVGFSVMLLVALTVDFMAGDGLKKFKRAVIVSFFSYGLMAFWLNLSFIKASLSIGTGGAEGSVGTAYLRFIPFVFLLAPAFFFLSLLIKRRALRLILIALGWILIFFSAAYFWFKNQTMLLPQPNRYLLQMHMGTALLLSWLLFLVMKKIFPKKLVWLSQIFYLLTAFSILYFPLKYIDRVWDLTLPHKNIRQTSEQQIASWLENNTQGERVFATGSSAFWLNTFSNIPQIRGGNDGVANPWMLHAIYQINTGENAPEGKEGETAICWLRALNVSYLVVNTHVSREIYHDFTNPEKFTQAAGVEEKANLEGDIIYKIPLFQPSLAQVVKKEDFIKLKPLKNAVDFDNLKKYVDYIDPPSPTDLAGFGEAGPPSGLDSAKRAGEAKFSWVGKPLSGKAKIRAQIKEGEAIALQINYNPGWKAYIDGKRIRINNDVIGFMFLDPGPADSAGTGEVEIDLVYQKTWDVWLGYLITILTIVGLIVYPRIKK